MDLTKNTKLYRLLISLETSLHSAQTRLSETELGKLLSDEFIEIGASGRTFNKKNILKRLPQETSNSIRAGNFKLRELSSGIIQITYHSCSQAKNQQPRYTLRSSIWRNESSQWKMLFHQGTVTKK